MRLLSPPMGREQAVTEATPNLIGRLKAAEPEAFNELVRQFHGPVYRLAARLVRNRDDAQEVAQEVFLAAYQGIAGFQGESALATWLLAIAYRKAMDRLRLRKANEWQLQGQLEELPEWQRATSVERFTDWEDTPEETYQRGELKLLLEGALEKVPAEARAVLELRDMQGLSFRETAQVLGISEGAARVRLHRVRQFLLAQLQDYASSGGRPK